MKKVRILITGGSGFVGRNFVNFIEKKQSYGVPKVEIIYLKSETLINSVKSGPHHFNSLKKIFNNIDVVLHMAGKCHSKNQKWDEFFISNCRITELILNLAVDCNVGKFLFLSTIKVLGEDTNNGIPFSMSSVPNPLDIYAKTKRIAEKLIESAAVKNSTMQFLILRCPLIYGKMAKGNYLLLGKMAKYGIPLPFGKIKNKRSLLYIENLCKIIFYFSCYENKIEGTHLICDPWPISTKKLYNKMLLYNGYSQKRNFKLSQSILKFIFMAIFKKSEYHKLTDNLEIKYEDLVDDQLCSTDIGLKEVIEKERGITL